jgi:hypothetical protein
MSLFIHLCMSDITGVTFPIPKLYMSRFFDEGKTIFIKPATIFKELRAGMKFVFYQSQEDTGYIGDAIIKKIEVSEDPYIFFDIFGNNIYLNKQELENYIKATEKWRLAHSKRKSRSRRNSRPRSKWIAIELCSITKYDMPMKPKRFISMSGQYIKDPDSD